MPLPRVQRTVQDQNGNLVPGVLGSVYNQGTGVLAPLYNDDEGTTPLSNPMTNDPQYASFKFYIAPGHYDLSFTKPGFTFEPIMDFQVPEDTVTLGTMATQNAHAVAITGGIISGLALPLAVASGGTGANNVATARGNLELGGMALQNTNAVSISGGNITGLATLDVGGAPGTLTVAGLVRFNASVGIAQAATAAVMLSLTYRKDTQYGIVLTPTVSDSGTQAVLFKNMAGTDVGSISTNATATAYATSSDPRLKDDVQDLPDALATLRRLRPVAFRWRVDGSPGQGFLADEVQQVVPAAVTGTPEAVDAAGQIMPMGLDASKLVVWLVGAVKDLAHQVDALTARLAAVEAA